MVAQLIIEQEKQEIAVFKSRGASTGQIFKSYLIESALFGGAALVVGPLLGMLLSKILGASNGFLSFINRGALNVMLTPMTYVYALAAIAVFIVTLLFPAYFAAKKNIISSNEEKNGPKKKPFWQKCFLDVFLLIISLYGIYSYSTMAKFLQSAVGHTGNLPLDPLLLVMASFFILSLALLFVRLYPYLIRLIFLVGKKFWSPSAYAGVLSVSRSSGREQFLIVFIIFSVSVGILSSMAARTINTNNADRVKYETGADIVVQDANWYASIINPDMPITPSGTPNYMSVVTEPDYSKYSNIKGIASTTRVMTISNTTVDGKKGASIYGIEPYQFGKTAWFRDDLLPYGWHYYLNELTQVQDGGLGSSSLKGQHKRGDTIFLSVQSKVGYRTSYYTIQAVICGFVDYWPGTVNSGDTAQSKNMVIANFDFLYSNFALSPYTVWMKKDLGVSSKQIYDEFSKRGLTFSSIEDTSQELLDISDDPFIQGQNGALTINFLISMLIAALGFLIYWIMSIQSRVHQFGILRAMGLKFRELLGIIVLEQALLSGVAVAAGALIGIFASRIYVPFIKVGYDTATQSIPFIVIANPGDLIKILITIGCIIAVGGIVLGVMVRRIKMDQAIKLGED
jgi:putative ABC transport system permease protein